MSSGIDLIAGLGNPGARYEGTRHNAGFWYVDALAGVYRAEFRLEAKFQAWVCRTNIADRDCWLVKPNGYMNRSGTAVAALARFYKLPVESILIAHDELDLPPGTARLKQGGGHGGHNGLRDIVDRLGSNAFARLRIGIGHPGSADLVTDYVLDNPGRDDRQQIVTAIDNAVGVAPLLVNGDMQKAMNELHSKS